jgi:peroxiredoxin
MARRSDAQLLDVGGPFPPLELTLTDGRHLVLPIDLSHPYNAVLVNRGSWCPYCVTQLTGFQAGLSRLAQAGIGVVSLSADPREDAAALVAKHGLQFPVAWGASVHGVASALGGYYDPHPADRPPYLQSAGFVLGPGGTVVTAVYSSGAIGRLAWQDVLGFVQYLRSHS